MTGFIHDQVNAIWRLFPGSSLTPELRKEIADILVGCMVGATMDSGIRKEVDEYLDSKGKDFH